MVALKKAMRKLAEDKQKRLLLIKLSEKST